MIFFCCCSYCKALWFTNACEVCIYKSTLLALPYIQYIPLPLCSHLPNWAQQHASVFPCCSHSPSTVLKFALPMQTLPELMIKPFSGTMWFSAQVLLSVIDTHGSSPPPGSALLSLVACPFFVLRETQPWLCKSQASMSVSLRVLLF